MPHINTVNPRQAKELIVKAMQVQLPVMLLGAPGSSKSSIVQQIAEQYDLEFIDIRLATHDPVDLEGIPRFKYNNRAEFVPFDLFPLDDDPVPIGKKGFLVMLDELTACPRSMQVAA